jgi:hypothetical protein
MLTVPCPCSLPNQHVSRTTSWNYNLTSYEAKRLLNLTEDLPFDHATAMSENKTTAVTETTWKSSNPANPPSASITRASSDVSLYMPVRRQSIIQTPGVATRASSTRELPALPNSNFRHSHPVTPNLSRQESFESYRSGIVSMPPRIPDPDSVPRVVTPCEDQYQSIGAFKLGSLRITNGSPIPPSPEVGKSRGGGGQTVGGASGQDGYFTGTHTHETSVAGPSTAYGPVQSAEPRDVRPSNLDPLSVNQVAVGNVPELDTVPKKTDVASDLLPEISFDPLLFPELSQPTSPLKTTSKVTAQEDELFEDEPQTEYSSIEILDIRLDPSAKQPHPEPACQMSTAFARTDSGFMSAASPTSESHTPLTKADSGYSSNVSLRSFQSKPRFPENQITASLEKQLSQPNQKDASTKSEGTPFPGEPETRQPAAPVREPPPPPVPPKDSPKSTPIGQPKLNVKQRKFFLDQGSVQDNDLTRANAPKATRHIPNPIVSLPPPSGDRGSTSPGSMPRTPGSVKSSRSDKSSSALSIGSGSQKQSRLQRLLTGSRRPTTGPPTVHATHALEHSSIPAIPRDVENKLREHTGQFPAATKKLAVKQRSSLDTLKTIFSVGSIEASLEAVNSIRAVKPVSQSEPQEAPWKQALQSVPASIANVAAHVIPRKPIVRKPVPAREEASQKAEPGASRRHGQGRLSLDIDAAHTWSISAVDAQAVGRSSRSPNGRAMSLTLPGERGAVLNSDARFPSPALPSPVAKAMAAENKSMTASPVNGTPNRPVSLRVPPPLRPQSSTSSLHRKVSRESIQSYPAALPLSRKGSRGTMNSRSSNQYGMPSDSGQSSPGGFGMDPRRLMSFRRVHAAQSSQAESPNWEAGTEHGTSHRSPQPFVSGGSRRNSISSVQSFDGYGIQRPSSSQGWQVRTPQQPLRHRASYDGDSHYYQQRHPRYGYPPSMSNGYTAPSKSVHDPRVRGQLDVASTWTRSQLDAAAGQWYQNGGYPPPSYGPRAGHHRHRSMGSRNAYAYGPNPPYRVLHSYNSPAYRNVPIWG